MTKRTAEPTATPKPDIREALTYLAKGFGLSARQGRTLRGTGLCKWVGYGAVKGYALTPAGRKLLAKLDVTNA